MRILHFFKTYYPDTYGGIEQVIYQLAEGAFRQGAEVDVLSLSKNSSNRNKTMDHHNVYTSKQNLYIASTGFSLSVINDYKKLSKRADIIHYHFPWPYMDLVHFIARSSKPCIVSYHSDIVKQRHLLQLYQPLMCRFLNDMDAVVASSPNYVRTSSVLNSLKKKVDIIPFGLEPLLYPIASTNIREKWLAMLPKRFFLFIGSLRYYKGLSYLLDAIVEFDYPLVIVGEGPYESKLKVQAFQLGLKNTYFVGPVSDEDKRALLELSYGVVFPSHLRSEAYGMTLVESAMYGKPMISCEIGTGTTYINLDGQTGITVKPEDSAALREALSYLWLNPDIASQMGNSAKSRFDQYFTADRMVNSYMDLYKKVIENHGK